MLLGAITTPGGPELIVILVIVILLFGAKKLPELGSSVGKSIRNFKKGISEGSAEAPDKPAVDEESTTSTATRREE
ncbi:MAG TPA: twin-arginine translocase TatA/TatE family subunit [Egibacteraceae bacterium]